MRYNVGPLQSRKVGHRKMDLLTNPMITNLLSITAYYNACKQNIKTGKFLFILKKPPKRNPKSPSDIWGPTGSSVLPPPLCPYLPAALVQLSWPPCWSFNTSDMVLPLYLWTCCSIGLEKPLPQIKGLICSLTSFKFVITSSFQFIITYHSFRATFKLSHLKLTHPPHAHIYYLLFFGLPFLPHNTNYHPILYYIPVDCWLLVSPTRM